MSSKVVHGFAWYTYPDCFGLDSDDVAEPGHPFAESSGEVHAPPEVLYYRPHAPTDDGFRNEMHRHSYLVMTKTQLRPKMCDGWDSEPASLTDKYKTEDGKVRIVRIVQTHHRHCGDLMECELKIED